VNEIKIAVLKREIATGCEDLYRDCFQTYGDATCLADEVCRRGIIRLNALRLKVAAKVHGKKK